VRAAFRFADGSTVYTGNFKVLDLRWRREGVDEPVGKGPINVGDRILFSAAIVKPARLHGRLWRAHTASWCM